MLRRQVTFRRCGLRILLGIGDSVKRTTVNSRFTASGSREAGRGEKVVSQVCCTVNTFRLCGFRFVD